jgi:Cu(I)/Ag(I) efflux system membrane protein CusA/SilA
MYNAQTGTPILVRDVGTVTYGPDMRRGVGELDGQGETVGGVVIMRFGENAQKVIERVKEKIKDLQPTLPSGLKIVTTYDRSDLIDRSVDNLKHTLIEELIIVSVVTGYHHPRVYSHPTIRHDCKHHVLGWHGRGHRCHGGCGCGRG